ncbi:hypothetical protein [Mycobacteroides abscessus]|nr:hypothetical protein [Mycobacteroides abscessus]
MSRHLGSLVHHLANVIAAMLVAAGLEAIINQDGLYVLADAMCWG